jgi:ectoine hydroxylase-related dioxygenase (phytanoyl-CoA dioxygenase family)
MNERQSYNANGYVHLKAFFDRSAVERIRSEAKEVFINQMHHRNLLPAGDPSEKKFETALYRFFREDTQGFVNCGKTCQHLISLHRLALNELLVAKLHDFGIKTPNICTRPVMFFNSSHLAKSEAYYKAPPHQDWRSMQGSLNSMVVWVPLIDIGKDLGALEIIPGSHLFGLLDSVEDDWYRTIEGTTDDQYVPVEVEAGDALFFSAFLLHRSGDNTTDSIRWSCHFRYNDLDEPTFIERKYPNPYIYKPEQDLITEDFPSKVQLQDLFRTNGDSNDRSS